MNETLYRWTFNFHKVVWQQNSGAVEEFILLYSAVYLRIQKWKNDWNRCTFAKAIVRIKVARFWPTAYVSMSVQSSELQIDALHSGLNFITCQHFSQIRVFEYTPWSQSWGGVFSSWRTIQTIQEGAIFLRSCIFLPLHFSLIASCRCFFSHSLILPHLYF